MRLRAGRCSHPLLRDELPIFPAAAVQPEVAQLRHVARLEVKITPSVRHPLFIGRPCDVAYAEWTEQFAAGEVERTQARRFRDRPRQNVHPTRAVLETAPGFVAHWKVQHEL